MKPAVLFDLGDVLVHLRFDRGARSFARLLGREHPLLADPSAFYTGPATAPLSTGVVSPRDFLAGLARTLDLRVPAGELAAAWADIFDPWPEMEALAAEVIEAGHPAYLLSNTDPLHFALLRERMTVPGPAGRSYPDGLLARFAGLHLSYEAGVNKPDPRFFAGALARFGLSPGGCVYLDDRPENVSAARALGIPGFVHRGDVEAVRAFLRSHGVAIG